MKSGYRIVDTNIFLRFFVDKTSKEALQAKELFTQHKIVVYPMVVAEIIWVLSSFYQYEKKELLFLTDFFEKDVFVIDNKEVVINAVELFVTSKLSFVDAYLLKSSESANIKLETLDKDLQSYSSTKTK